MKILMEIKMPVEKFNHAAIEGMGSKKIQKILEELKPQGSYFTTKNGKRTAFLVVDLKQASEIPRYAEPWFISFNASIDFYPVMTPEDLKKGVVEEAVKKWS